MSTDSARPLGEWLQQRREELGISLEQAEAETRIRFQYLEALESENFDVLPDPMVGRGFLRNYAAYLELDPKEASDRFSAIVAPPEPEPVPDMASSPFGSGPFRPVALHEMPGRRSRLGWILGAVLVLIVALALLVWWVYPYATEWWAQRASANAPVAATSTPKATEISLPTATHTPTATAKATDSTPVTEVPPTLTLTFTPSLTPSPSPSPSPSVYTGIFIELVFTDTSWIQVTVDGVRQFQGELETDTYRSWYGEERIELRVGNAGAVLVTVNGQLIGTLGEPGDVVDRVFEKVEEGVIEATVTPEPTTDETAEPTAGAPPTAAPQPTATTQPAAAPTDEPTGTPPPPALSPTATLTPTATITPTTSQ